MTTKTVLILLGAPGSGKGTQSVRLAEHLRLPHISTGDLFRKHIKMGTALGKTAKEYIDRGQLVPDELVLDILSDRVKEPDCAKGYILDGFPRKQSQAEALTARLSKNDKVVVVQLAVRDEVLIDRLAGRLTCQACGHIFQGRVKPPRVAGICDQCGGPLVQRDDDKEEVVRARLLVYAKETAPLIDYYKSKHLLYQIDGEKNPDQVFTELVRVVT